MYVMCKKKNTLIRTQCTASWFIQQGLITASWWAAVIVSGQHDLQDFNAGTSHPLAVFTHGLDEKEN